MRRRKLLHLFWIIPLLALLAAGGYLYYLYSIFTKPYFADIETNLWIPHEANTSKIDNVFKIVNKNNASLHVDSVHYILYLDGEKYGVGKETRPFTVKANDTTSVDMEYEFDIDKFVKNYQKTGKDSALHRVDFDFYVDLWKFNSVHIPYTFEENSAVFKKPGIKFGEVTLKKLGLKESLLEAELLLDNPGDKMYNSMSLDYTFRIGDVELAGGRVLKDQILPREGSLSLSLPVKVEVKDAFTEAGLLKEGFKEKPYSLTIHVELRSATGTKPPVYDFDIVRTGKVRDLLEDYKEKRQEKKEQKREEKK